MSPEHVLTEIEAACVLMEEAASGLRRDGSWIRPMRLTRHAREASARAARVILEELHGALVGHANAPHEAISCGA